MILVTGGTGFVGKNLIKHLVETGSQVRTLLRPSPLSPSLPRGIPVEVAVCSLNDERGLRAAMKGIDVIYHLVGSERLGIRSNLSGVDVEGTRALAEVAARAGVERIFYLSHLGADRASAYPVLKAKAIAEHHLINSGVNYTIFRFGPIFGPGDQFTTAIARLIRVSPSLFLMPGTGETHIQPIWIDDVVGCLEWALQDPGTVNQIYSLGGVDYLSFRQVITILLETMQTKRILVNISPAYLRMIAVWMEHNNPTFPVSSFWLDYLAADRTCPVDGVPRLFGLMPARFHQQLDYLRPVPRNLPRKGKRFNSIWA